MRELEYSEQYDYIWGDIELSDDIHGDSDDDHISLFDDNHDFDEDMPF